MGSLTAKAAKKNANTRDAGAIRSVPAIISGIPTMPISGIDRIAITPTDSDRNTAKMATNMSAPPASVNSTNFIAEYLGLPLPHIEMSMYMGMTSNSKNMKKSSRSRLTNTPITADSSINNHMKYSAIRWVMDRDANVAAMPSSPVNSTNGALSPSTPSKYDDFSVSAVSQSALSIIWTPPASLS